MISTESSHPKALILAVTFDAAINYAFQQNAIPVIKELHFQNDGTARKDLIIRVTTEPTFALLTRIPKPNDRSYGVLTGSQTY